MQRNFHSSGARVGDETMQLQVTVAEQLVGGVDLVLGMDVISMLGVLEYKTIQCVSAKRCVLRR